jgi:hypothetical protein
MQSSLPAGWLAFTGRASNPLDRYKRFQITLILLFWIYPGANLLHVPKSAVTLLNGGRWPQARVTWVQMDAAFGDGAMYRPPMILRRMVVTNTFAQRKCLSLIHLSSDHLSGVPTSG